MELYLGLEPFPEVPAVLATLREAGFRTAILSNGSPRMLEALVKRSNLDAMFDAVLSVDAVGVFKTHPKGYQYALDSLGLPANAISFQSSNAWDAHGASDFGMRVVWCNRYGQRRERLPGQPGLRDQDAGRTAGAAQGGPRLTRAMQPGLTQSRKEKERKRKRNRFLLLFFPFFYFSESGLFNGLWAKKVEKIFLSRPLAFRLQMGAGRWSPSARIAARRGTREAPYIPSMRNL